MKSNNLKTGIILNITEGNATILKNGGEFITLPAKPGWQKGDLILLPKSPRSFGLFFSIAACFILIFTLSFAGYSLCFTQTALISLDVNPSIELSLNRFQRILSVTARNEDGQEILFDKSFKYHSLSEVLETILKLEQAEGYFQEDSDIVLTIFSSNTEEQSELLNKVQSLTNTFLSAYAINLTPEYFPVNQQTVENAHTCGVSPGKYLYLLELKTLSPEINISDYCQHSISQIKGQISICEETHKVGSNICHLPVQETESAADISSEPETSTAEMTLPEEESEPTTQASEEIPFHHRKNHHHSG